MVLTISGKKNKMRVYFLSWLRNKILIYDPAVAKKPGFSSVGDLEGNVLSHTVAHTLKYAHRWYDVQIDKLPAHTLSRHRSGERDPNVCVGAKAISQIYALQDFY